MHTRAGCMYVCSRRKDKAGHHTGSICPIERVCRAGGPQKILLRPTTVGTLVPMCMHLGHNYLSFDRKFISFFRHDLNPAPPRISHFRRGQPYQMLYRNCPYAMIDASRCCVALFAPSTRKCHTLSRSEWSQDP